MAYIVKSSLDIGGKIIPYNEQNIEKMVKDKEEYLKKKAKLEQEEVEQEEVELKAKKETKDEIKPQRNNRRNQKVGEDNA